MEDPIEQTETTEDSTEILGLVLYQTLFYFIYSRKLLQVSVTIQNTKYNYYKFWLQYKIQNPSHYFNVSGNIIK